MSRDHEMHELNAAERSHLEQIEAVLEQGTSGDQDIRTLESFAVYLASSIPEPDPVMATSVESRLMDAFQEQKERTSIGSSKRELQRQEWLRPLALLLHRPAVGAALVLLVLLLVVAVSPPLRAAAQELLVQIGNLLVTDEQTWAQRQFEEGEPIQMEEGTVEPWYLWPNLDELVDETPFPVLVPQYLPEDVQFQSGEVIEEEQFVSLLLFYGGPNALSIEQTMYSEAGGDELAVGETVEPVTITVRGQTGYWLADIPSGLYGKTGPLTEEELERGEGVMPVEELIYTNTLVWEENGIVYKIHALSDQPPKVRGDDESRFLENSEVSGLSLEEALRIAESMAPYEE
jgi:hypothetical protein